MFPCDDVTMIEMGLALVADRTGWLRGCKHPEQPILLQQLSTTEHFGCFLHRHVIHSLVSGFPNLLSCEYKSIIYTTSSVCMADEVTLDECISLSTHLHVLALITLTLCIKGFK